MCARFHMKASIKRFECCQVSKYDWFPACQIPYKTFRLIKTCREKYSNTAFRILVIHMERLRPN